MSVELTLCYVLYPLGIALLVAYLAVVFRRYGYALSIFNVTLFQSSFALFLAPLFFVSDESWAAVWIYDAASMSGYLAQSLCLNLVGYCVFMLILLVLTVRGGSGRVGALTDRVSCGIDSRVVNVALVFAVVAFVVICLAFNGTFPLFNAGRAFYVDRGISPVYLATLEALSLFGLYYGLRWAACRKGLPGFIVCVICLLLTGSRGTVLAGVLLPSLVYFAYITKISGDRVRARQRRTVIVLGACAVVLVAGMLMLYLRDGLAFQGPEALVRDIFYGNSFSDIRDGALILKGMDDVFDGDPIWGLTYLAGLISFIPSSLSPLRHTWAWGRFSTVMLFDLDNHLGFRGGNFMEAYVNFGYVGVIAVAVLCAVILFWLERMFRERFLDESDSITGKEVFVCAAMLQLFSALECSAGAYNFYAIALITIGLIAVSRAVALVDARRKAKGPACAGDHLTVVSEDPRENAGDGHD